MNGRDRIAGGLITLLIGASGSVALHAALGLVLAPVPAMRVGVEARALLDGEKPDGDYTVVATSTVGEGFYFRSHSTRPERVGQRLTTDPQDVARAQRHLSAVKKQGPIRAELPDGWRVTTAQNQLSAELVQRQLKFPQPWPWRIGLISVAVGLVLYLLGSLRWRQHWALLLAVLGVEAVNVALLPGHAVLVQGAVGEFLGRTTGAQIQLQELGPLYLALMGPPFAVGVIAIMSVAMRQKR